ncbi:hypothetical protein [Pseudomonas syringae]
MQDEWAKRNVAGYKRNAAPAVLLKALLENHTLLFHHFNEPDAD